MKAVALNWMASGAMATNTAAGKAAARSPVRRCASCAVIGMSSNEAMKAGMRAAHSTGPNRG